jgi:SAM-dependent methyltransferase
VGSHAELETEKMPGHWLLARLGKRVLRPGGLELTRQLVDALALGPDDRIVELAPGLGVTTELVLARGPASYTGVERDAAAADSVRRLLVPDDKQVCVIGSAEATGLADASASVVFGEAFLTIQRESQKRRIVAEAHRLLAPGGRYGLHELCLTPDDLPQDRKDQIHNELSDAIHVGARPLTAGEWRQLLEQGGFRVRAQATAPMHLLEPKRVIADEGTLGAMRIVANVLRDRTARERVLAMRQIFRRYEQNLGAIMLVASKNGAKARGRAPRQTATHAESPCDFGQ